MATVARVVFVAGALFSIVGVTVAHLRGRASAGPARQVVLVIIDGMPSQLLAANEPAAAETAFDAFARAGCSVAPGYTSRTYTSGYFSVLYTGNLRGRVRPNETLPSRLRSQGVGFRWLGFHPNGIPETAHVVDYGGLRSALLTERWTWLPRLLGLDYHVFLTWDDSRRHMGERVDAFYRALNGETDEDRVWRDVVPRQVLAMRRRHRRSLLVAHVSVTKHLVHSLEDGSFGDAAAGIQALIAHATKRGYSYDPAFEKDVAAYAGYYRRRIDQYGRWLEALRERLRAEGALQDTLLIVSADHGSMLGRGRLWYGPHPDEEAARVPLVLFAEGRRCPQGPPADTLDVLATVSAWLDVPLDTVPQGRSLLRAREPRLVPSLTVRDDTRATWFLLVHDGEGRYVFNLHPRGDGSSVYERLRGYAPTPAAAPDPTSARRVLARTLRLYGIPMARVHPALRGVQ
jgi:hypothetical protein